MKNYLAAHTGQRLVIVREGFPQEIIITGTITRVEGDVVIVTDDDKVEIAVPIARILSVCPPDSPSGTPVGFI